MKKNIKIVTTKLVRESSVTYDNIGGITTPEKLANLVRPLIGDSAAEQVIGVYVNSNNEPQLIAKLFKGCANQSLIHPREVLQYALLGNATGIFLAHNHPSGNMTPSTEDLTITNRISESCKIMGINFIDHIIISGKNNDYYSIMDK